VSFRCSGCKEIGHLCHQCTDEVVHRHSLAAGNLRLTLRDNSYEMEDWSDWNDTQAVDSNGNCCKSPSCFPNQINSTKNLIIHEESCLELDPQVGEIPLKGVMGVKVLHRREVCPIMNDMRECLEGVGCITEVVRDNVLVVVA